VTAFPLEWSLERPVAELSDVPVLACGETASESGGQTDNLSREVYCVLGMPIDAVDMGAVVLQIRAAADRGTPFLISTPNLNFMVNSALDVDFRESLLASDLCPADGMPIIWIARLLGIPIKNRVAGSDIFEALKIECAARPLKVLLFGGAEGVAAAAGRALNLTHQGLRCVGSFYPGFGTIEEMSRDEIIEKINSSDADFLVAALSAKKGQLWLKQCRDRVRIPVRAHLGAVLNFEAGTVKRAPPFMRRLGLEWLWRIKEEPYLWRRYWNDGGVLLRILFGQVLPLALEVRWTRLRDWRRGHELLIKQVELNDSVVVRFHGAATVRHIEKAVFCFRSAIRANKPILIDLSETDAIDARFLGLLLMLRKELARRGADLKLTGALRSKRFVCLNGLGFLLTADKVT
jgi:N-acetylglucosaminyldiphosphoundecaprenol N-acetyl-beta-D-mannosaminyltransferase